MGVHTGLCHQVDRRGGKTLASGAKALADTWLCHSTQANRPSTPYSEHPPTRGAEAGSKRDMNVKLLPDAPGT